MASPVTEQLTQALPLLAVGAGQTLAISLLAILFATLGGSVTACWPSKGEG